MPVLCDFTVIQDGTVTIGDNGPEFVRSFDTGGRHNTQALLMINVKGLTDKFAQVQINNTTIKALQPSTQANESQWFSQHMVIPSSLLSPAQNNNQIRIKRVPETGPVGSFDDFQIRDVVVFFHQSA